MATFQHTNYDPSVDGVLDHIVYALGHCNINLVKNSGYVRHQNFATVTMVYISIFGTHRMIILGDSLLKLYIVYMAY